MVQEGDDIEIYCVSFEVVQYACLRLNGVSYEPEDISINVNVEKTSDFDQGTLGIISELSVFADPVGENNVEEFTDPNTDPENGVEVGLISTHIRFLVENFSRITSSDDEVEVPAPIATDMIGQAYDGLRGAWAAKSSGTHLDHIVLPSQNRRSLATRVFDFKIHPEEVTIPDEGDEINGTDTPTKKREVEDD
jgi:hypothetical protein